MKIAKRALEISPSLTLELTAKANKLKAEGRDVVSFGAGEPDFNTPEYIRDAAKEALDKGMTKYTPASGTAELKKAVCDRFALINNLIYKPENIVISNGAKHALYNALAAVVEEGDEVIIPSPFWLTYPELVKLVGGVPVFVKTAEENGFKLTATELENAVTDKTAAVIINNPNNPTGAVYTEREIKALAAVIEKTNIAVISDEIYEALNYTDKPVYSIASCSEMLKSRTIIVNGVSKTYSMTGWRIGFTASDAAVAKAISSMQSHMTSNPNSIAQYASLAAYKGAEGIAFLDEMKSSFDRRRRLIMKKLDEIPALSYVKPEGAFYIFVCVKGIFGKSYRGSVINSAHELADILLDAADVTVIPCESFGNGDYIRLSYAVSDEDIVKGVERIGRFVSALE